MDTMRTRQRPNRLAVRSETAQRSRMRAPPDAALSLAELVSERIFAHVQVRPIAPTWAYRTMRVPLTAVRRARAGFEVNFVVKGEPITGAVGAQNVRCEAGDCLLIPRIASTVCAIRRACGSTMAGSN